MGDARYEFRSGTRLLGYPTASGRTLRLRLSPLDPLTELSVWAAGRRLDAGVGADVSRLRMPGTVPPEEPPVAVAAHDPAAPGPYSAERLRYVLPGMPVAGFEAPVEVVGEVVAPTDVAGGLAGPMPLVLFLHGRHNTCYRGGPDGESTADWPCLAGWRPVPSHTGYRYMTRVLASQGYLTVSIAANGVNGQDGRSWTAAPSRARSSCAITPQAARRSRQARSHRPGPRHGLQPCRPSGGPRASAHAVQPSQARQLRPDVPRPLRAGQTLHLSETDRARLHEAGRPDRVPVPAGTYARRIFERLLVDLSWASSRMEGNTYSILETERLLQFGEEATGKNRKEAVMILNHKEAIQYVVDNLASIAVSRADICNIHALLADGLLIDPAMAGRLRRLAAGITHSSYRPLEDQYEIEEEFGILIQKAAAITDPFEQSFFLLVHIPYLQAFDDINKRTSRIASNIPLLKADLAPMSFVTMDDGIYIDALIGTYELNNVALLREVYLDAYITSAENYKTLRAEVESPEKAALVYREFVRTAVRRCVLEWKEFRAEKVMAMTEVADIPEADRKQVVNYVRQEFAGLHEGNIIRYRLKPDDLAGLGSGR